MQPKYQELYNRLLKNEDITQTIESILVDIGKVSYPGEADMNAFIDIINNPSVGEEAKKSI